MNAGSRHHRCNNSSTYILFISSVSGTHIRLYTNTPILLTCNVQARLKKHVEERAIHRTITRTRHPKYGKEIQIETLDPHTDKHTNPGHLIRNYFYYSLQLGKAQTNTSIRYTYTDTETNTLGSRDGTTQQAPRKHKRSQCTGGTREGRYGLGSWNWLFTMILLDTQERGVHFPVRPPPEEGRFAAWKLCVVLP